MSWESDQLRGEQLATLALISSACPPVEDPVLHITEVFRSLLGRVGEWDLDLGLPVGLDDVLELFAIGGRGIWDVCRISMPSNSWDEQLTVIREPSLQLRLMPFVVDYSFGSVSISLKRSLRKPTCFAEPVARRKSL